MKKMSMKKKLVAVISGVLGLMMVGVVAVNGIGAKASDYPVGSVQDIDGRGVYTMDSAKFRGYSWIAPVYGEENLFGKREVEGGTMFKASNDEDAVLKFTVKGCKGAERARCYVYQVTEKVFGQLYEESCQVFERDVENGEDREIELRFPQKAGEAYGYVFCVNEAIVDYYSYDPSETGNSKPITLRVGKQFKLPKNEAFEIEVGGTLNF